MKYKHGFWKHIPLVRCPTNHSTVIDYGQLQTHYFYIDFKYRTNTAHNTYIVIHVYSNVGSS